MLADSFAQLHADETLMIFGLVMFVSFLINVNIVNIGINLIISDKQESRIPTVTSGFTL